MQMAPAARPGPNAQATKSAIRTTTTLASGNIQPSKGAFAAAAGALKTSSKPIQTPHHDEFRTAIKRSWDSEAGDKYKKQNDNNRLAVLSQGRPTVHQSVALSKGPSTKLAPHDATRSMPDSKRLKFDSPTSPRGKNEATTSSRRGSNLGTKIAPFWLDDDSTSKSTQTERRTTKGR